ncbi:MAG TPA: TerB family tellurite resistance protein [Polyangiaceae bacterium]|nr:TerB family tellurite resistance protein [Polyangiaceae bacterium]
MATRIEIDEESHFLPDTKGRRAELRERLDQASARAQNRKAIADTVGSEESALLDRLEQLGFTGDSARVLDLLPLVHVAWADGKVDRRERAAVLAVVDHRGIAKDSDACLLIESLLEQRPSETFMAESFALVHELAAKRGGDGRSLVELCADVAQASGGLFGLGNRVDHAEYELIQRIADAFGEDAQAAFLARLGKPC